LTQPGGTGGAAGEGGGGAAGGGNKGFNFMGMRNRSHHGHSYNGSASGTKRKEAWNGVGGLASSSVSSQPRADSSARKDGEDDEENNGEEQHRHQLEKLLGKRAK
jgi:hypothetical protein